MLCLGLLGFTESSSAAVCFSKIAFTINTPRYHAWCTKIQKSLIPEQIHKSDPDRGNLTDHMLGKVWCFLCERIVLPCGLKGSCVLFFHFKSSGSQDNWKQAGCTRCFENNEKLLPGLKKYLSWGNFPLFFQMRPGGINCSQQLLQFSWARWFLGQCL